MIRIELPWPPRELHPNGRPHFMAKAKAIKKYRADAATMTLKAGVRRNDPDIPQSLKVTVIFCPPSKRGDVDNMLAAIKSGLDGIADVIGVDDSKWQIALRKDEPVKGGAVRIELEAA
jgi:crossover junction endodeoxyribonuclease RusA